MRAYRVEAQEGTSITSRVLSAEDPWDAIAIARREGLPGIPFRVTLLKPDRIFEVTMEGRPV